MLHKLSIVTFSVSDRFEKRGHANAFDAPQTPTNYSLIVVCITSLMFALAGYGMSELTLLD